MRYKKDDKIKIIDNNNGHSYNIGDECYIIKVGGFFYDTSKTKGGEPTKAGWIIEEDCELAEETITPGMRVGTSDVNQEYADENYKENIKIFYVGKNKKGRYIVENDNGDLYNCKYISIKKEEKIPEYTIEELKDKIGNFNLIK